MYLQLTNCHDTNTENWYDGCVHQLQRLKSHTAPWPPEPRRRNPRPDKHRAATTEPAGSQVLRHGFLWIRSNYSYSPELCGWLKGLQGGPWRVRLSVLRTIQTTWGPDLLTTQALKRSPVEAKKKLGFGTWVCYAASPLVEGVWQGHALFVILLPIV